MQYNDSNKLSINYALQTSPSFGPALAHICSAQLVNKRLLGKLDL